MTLDLEAEWLEADATGGFASGTVGGIRTRRYHALLLTATNPPTGRVVLVNGFEAWVEGGFGQRRADRASATARHRRARPTRWRSSDFTHRALAPLDASACRTAARSPARSWWTGRAGRRCCAGGGRSGERALPPLRPPAAVGARLSRAATREPGISISPRESPAATSPGGPIRDRPAIAALSNGAYRHAPDWYRNFLYARERERGLDDRRGSRHARHLHLGARRRRGGADPARGRRARRLGRRSAAARIVAAEGAARARARRPPAGRRGCLSRRPRRRAHRARGLSLVHRLGPRHVHRHARADARQSGGSTMPRRSCSPGRAR